MSLDVQLVIFKNKKAMAPTEIVYESNITHNLNKMAEAAGIYMELWRPEEIGVKKAEQLIEPLRIGIAKLGADPEFYKTFNAANGWGTYVYFFPFVVNYWTACVKYPIAKIEVSR